MCSRANMSVVRANNTWKQLKLQQEASAEMDDDMRNKCRSNLLKFYHEKLKLDMSLKRTPQFTLANEFATIIFSMYATASACETDFSNAKYIKNKSRSRLTDSRLNACLHCSNVPVHEDPESLTTERQWINPLAALSCNEQDEAELKKKYVGKTITKSFPVTRPNGIVEQVPYDGVVTKVEWIDSHASYQMVVEYEDGDTEDLEPWQLSASI